MLVLDTSILVGALTGSAASLPLLVAVIERGERISIPTLVLYEWLRGPRAPAELEAQERLVPADHALPFGQPEAVLAADLYRSLGTGRKREVDLAIAAHALVRGCELWTLNERDFADVPGLMLFTPR